MSTLWGDAGIAFDRENEYGTCHRCGYTASHSDDCTGA